MAAKVHAEAMRLLIRLGTDINSQDDPVNTK